MLDAARGLLPATLRRHVESLERDIGSIVRRLDGRRPPSFSLRGGVAGGGLRAAPSEPRGLVLRRARIAEIVRETPDAVSIVLTDVEGRSFDHEPGQFLTLQLDIDGRLTRRAYSIAWSSDDGLRVAIGVKRVAGGRVSSRLCESARPGDVFDVLGPSGSFTPAPDAEEALLVAGGSGITPLRRIAEAMLARSPSSRVALVFANRGAADVMFASSLADLADRYPSRFAVVHVHDVLAPESSALLGPLDGDVLPLALAGLPFQLAPDAPVFVCGPEGMMRAARACLEARGVPAARIREERFASPESPRGDAPASEADGRAQPVTFRRKDGSVVVLSPRPGATVLEAGLEASVPLGYSCGMGGCGACRVKLLAGEVSMLAPNCLDEEERAAGYILACVATAVTPITVEAGT